VAELDRDDIRQELHDNLAREPAVRLDLFVRDPARGIEVFQNAARASGVKLYTDAATSEKLKKRQIHSLVIYTETLTAAELTGLFAKLSNEDVKFTPRVCESLHVAAIGRADEMDLKNILGIDPGLFKRATDGTHGGAGQVPKSQANIDPKPISADTIGSVVKSVTTPNPTPGDAREKSAMLLTWQTSHAAVSRTAPGSSAELKQFLANRRDRKATAVPTMIVIRPTN
jgi:hypothetical protein